MCIEKREGDYVLVCRVGAGGGEAGSGVYQKSGPVSDGQVPAQQRQIRGSEYRRSSRHLAGLGMLGWQDTENRVVCVETRMTWSVTSL